MAWESAAAFWGVSLLFVLTPGADWAYAIAAGLRHRSVLPSVLGLLVGHAVATVVVAAGVAALVARSPVVMTALTMGGALYLVWMGISALSKPATSPMSSPVTTLAKRLLKAQNPIPVSRTAPQPVLVPASSPVGAPAHGVAAHGRSFATTTTSAVDAAASTSWWRQLAAGAGVSGLNPKVFLLFLALLPQFTDPTGAWPVAAQIVALGLVHVLSCAVVYTAAAVGARTVLRTRPGAARVVTRLSGAAMVVIGVVLLVERLAVHP